MSTNTISLAVPEAMRDQEEQARKGLRELIEEALSSGPGQAITPQRAAQLKTLALGKPR